MQTKIFPKCDKNSLFTIFYALQKACPLGAAAMVRAQYSTENTDLREVMAQKVPVMQEKVKAFRKSHGSTKVGEITVDMVSGVSLLISNYPNSIQFLPMAHVSTHYSQ